MHKLALVIAFAFLTLTPHGAAAQSSNFGHQPIGSHPYSFQQRSQYNSLTLIEQRRRDNRAARAASGPGGSASSTISVGNWTQMTMTLGDGAQGLIITEDQQSNWGHPTSTSNVNSQNSEGDQAVNNGGP